MSFGVVSLVLVTDGVLQNLGVVSLVLLNEGVVNLGVLIVIGFEVGFGVLIVFGIVGVLTAICGTTGFCKSRVVLDCILIGVKLFGVIGGFGSCITGADLGKLTNFGVGLKEGIFTGEGTGLALCNKAGILTLAGVSLGGSTRTAVLDIIWPRGGLLGEASTGDTWLKGLEVGLLWIRGVEEVKGPPAAACKDTGFKVLAF